MTIKFYGKEGYLEIYPINENKQIPFDIGTIGQEMDCSDIFLDLSEIQSLIKFLQSQLLEINND